MITRFSISLAGAALAVLVAWAALAGCRYESIRNEPYRPPEKNERTFQRLKKRDPETGVVVREWTAYLEPGRRAVKHGEEIVRYPDGALQWRRSFAFGEPAGEWTSWYPDGTRRSHAVFAGPEVAAEMTFWHPNGQLSARGPAINGVREGEWTVWHANGVVAARGAFLRSLREGEWSFWDASGQLVERVVFDAHSRIGKDDVGVREASAADLERPPPPTPLGVPAPGDGPQ